jgi:hypothetical protein
MKKIVFTNAEHAMAFNAAASDGEIVASGKSARYALSVSPMAASVIAALDGTILAVSAAGRAWIPTREGLDAVTRAAEILAGEVVDDVRDAWEQSIERHDPMGD